MNDEQRVEAAKATRVLKWVADKHGVTVGDLIGPVRAVPIATARFEAEYILRTRLGLGLKQIGYYLNRDHSTVIHGIQVYCKRNGLTVPEKPEMEPISRYIRWSQSPRSTQSSGASGAFA